MLEQKKAARLRMRDMADEPDELTSPWGNRLGPAGPVGPVGIPGPVGIQGHVGAAGPDDPDQPRPQDTPPWEPDPKNPRQPNPNPPVPDPVTVPKPAKLPKPTGPWPEAPEVPDEVAKVLQRMQDMIDAQEYEIIKLKAANPHSAGKLSHDEVVRLAQAKLDKQFAAGNVGQYEWRTQVHGMRQPIVMRCDSQDRDAAIGKLYAKHGIAFNAKRMDMRLVG